MASVARLKAKSEELRSTMPEEALHHANTNTPNAAKARPGLGKPFQSSTSRRRQGDGIQMDAAQLAADYEAVRHRYEDVLKENETLKGEQKRRMESYMRRETNYQAEIEDLKAELERQSKARPPEDERMMGLRNEHRKVIERLDSAKSKEAQSLQEQEKDLLRAFRARLWDVQFELETERSKKDDGALEWIEKTKTLGKELDWSRDEALRLDRMNQFLSKENSKLKTQIRSQEDDREFIVRQMLALKKENARLKTQWEEMERSPTPASPPGTAAGSGLAAAGRAQSAGVRGTVPQGAAGTLGRPMTAGAAAFRALEDLEASESAPAGTSLAASERVKELMLQQAESEERYREVVARLKRLLDVERRNLRAVRAAHAKDLQSRTELETLLRACVDDVRKEISVHRQGVPSPSKAGSAAAAAAVASARTVGVDDLGPKERERALELLLSQERVVALLYERTFPIREAEGALPEEAGAEDGDEAAIEGADGEA